MSSNSKHSSGLLYSLIGVVLVLAIVLVVNRIVGASGAKLDLTEKGLYTLSDGTKNILAELETPITLRFYATKDSELVLPDDKAFIRRIGDLLKEYRKAAPSGKVKLEFIDPEPFSEEVDDARYNGMRPFVSGSGEEVFRGLTIEQLEERFAIPLIQRGNEPMLEYEISRAISRFGDKELPVIGLMTDLALRGFTPPRNPQQPFMQQQQQQGSPPWLLYEELQRDYRVREFNTTSAQKIGEEVKALVVVHPNSITEEVEYEIDQYLLRGGSVIAFLDSFSELSQTPPQTGNSSNLPTLLPAWGWTFEPADVVVDNEYGAKVAADIVQPAILRVPRAGINKDGGPVTDQLQSVDMIYSGAFYPEDGAPEGVKKEILMQSSTSAGTASPFALQSYMRELQTAFQGGQKLDEFDFDATGNTYVLGLRLTGSFKTAFPDGRPTDNEREEGEEATADEDGAESEEEKKAEEEDKDHLNESVQDSAVILFADTDMLYDQYVARLANIQGGGRLVMGYPNSNLALAQGMIDQVAGDMNLIKVRSRGTVRRPFTTFERMKKKAGEQKQSELAKINEKYNELTAELNTSVQQDEETGQQFLRAADVEEANEKLREELKKIGKARRELDRELRRDIKWEGVKIQIMNIVLIPLIVLIVGIVHIVLRRSRTSAS